jgi:hypothetical protein
MTVKHTAVTPPTTASTSAAMAAMTASIAAPIAEKMDPYEMFIGGARIPDELD